MKNKTKILLSAINFALALLFCATSVFAWFALSDNASDAEFKFARINSEVYFYTANDFDLNGSPDLLDDGASPSYPEEEKHDEYYKEKRSFNYLDKREAYAEGTGVVTKSVEIQNYLTEVVPTQVYTIKLSVVNKGDSTNRLSVRFNEQSALSENASKLYATLAVRACIIKNDDCDVTETPTVEVGAWKYFCDTATTGGGFGELSPFEPIDLFGLDELMKDENKNKAVNVVDIWLQFKMVPYLQLSQMAAFANLGIMQEQYQTLQSQTFSLDFSVVFQVDSESLTK